MAATGKSPCLLPHKVYNVAWGKAKAANWVKGNRGGSATKHFCFGCISGTPELSTWHMQKILTRK
jgi:hypothetical protein